jgi:ABC-type transporter MlaC component
MAISLIQDPIHRTAGSNKLININFLKRILFAVCLLFGSLTLSSLPYSNALCAALDAPDPKVFIENLLTKGVNLLNDNSKPLPSKESEFRTLLRENFHLKSIAGSALRRGEAALEPKEKLNKYLELFESMIFRVYMKQVEQLSLHGFSITHVSGLPDGATVVKSSIERVDNSDPFKVDWILYFKENRYWVFDVVVDGVSLGQVQKQKIQDIRQGGNLDALIDVMHTEYGQ